MQVLVKKPRIKIEAEGSLPKKLLKLLKKEYPDMEVISETDEEAVDITTTEWYKKMKKKMTPGSYLRIYRENAGLSQSELAKKLGTTYTRIHISEMENDKRGISKENAKKLSKIFDQKLEKFI